jgi:hypothetical protein
VKAPYDLTCSRHLSGSSGGQQKVVAAIVIPSGDLSGASLHLLDSDHILGIRNLAGGLIARPGQRFQLIFANLLP